MRPIDGARILQRIRSVDPTALLSWSGHGFTMLDALKNKAGSLLGKKARSWREARLNKFGFVARPLARLLDRHHRSDPGLFRVFPK